MFKEKKNKLQTDLKPSNTWETGAQTNVILQTNITIWESKFRQACEAFKEYAMYHSTVHRDIEIVFLRRYESLQKFLYVTTQEMKIKKYWTGCFCKHSPSWIRQDPEG